jgi:hypothetical protein
MARTKGTALHRTRLQSIASLQNTSRGCTAYRCWSSCGSRCSVTRCGVPALPGSATPHSATAFLPLTQIHAHTCANSRSTIHTLATHSRKQGWRVRRATRSHRGHAVLGKRSGARRDMEASEASGARARVGHSLPHDVLHRARPRTLDRGSGRVRGAAPFACFNSLPFLICTHSPPPARAMFGAARPRVYPPTSSHAAWICIVCINSHAHRRSTVVKVEQRWSFTLCMCACCTFLNLPLVLGANAALSLACSCKRTCAYARAHADTSDASWT